MKSLQKSISKATHKMDAFAMNTIAGLGQVAGRLGKTQTLGTFHAEMYPLPPPHHLSHASDHNVPPITSVPSFAEGRRVGGSISLIAPCNAHRSMLHAPGLVLSASGLLHCRSRRGSRTDPPTAQWQTRPMKTCRLGRCWMATKM